MALIFQYGSNMSSKRLNSADRLAGDAKVLSTGRTSDRFDLVFSVWSKSNECAAAAIVASSSGERIFGVIYEVPDFLMTRESAKTHARKSMDAIEGEGVNYIKREVQIEDAAGTTVTAITYVVKEPRTGLKTSMPYVTHILNGLHEHQLPADYKAYVVGQIVQNNPDLTAQIEW